MKTTKKKPQTPAKKQTPTKSAPAPDKKKAVVAAKQALAAIDQLSARTKGMKEFVLCIDNNLDRPVCNCGAVMTVERDAITTLYAVVNLVDHGTFLTADQLDGVKQALIRNNSKTVSDIATISPTIAVAPIFNGVTLPMLTNSKQSAMLLGMFLFSVYINNQFSPFFGKKIDIKNFATKCRCYFNNFPAGLGCGTSISMVPLSAIPHMTPQLVSSPSLFGFEPGTKNVVLAVKNTQTGTVQKISTSSSMVEFYDEELAAKSKQAEELFNMMVIFERLDKRIDEVVAAKQKPTTKKKR